MIDGLLGNKERNVGMQSMGIEFLGKEHEMTSENSAENFIMYWITGGGFVYSCSLSRNTGRQNSNIPS